MVPALGQGPPQQARHRCCSEERKPAAEQEQASPEALLPVELCQHRQNWKCSQQLFTFSLKGGCGFPLSLAMEDALSRHIQTTAPEALCWRRPSAEVKKDGELFGHSLEWRA